MGCSKAVLRGKSKLSKLEKEKQMKSKVIRRKKYIKIRAKIHEIENRKSVEKINKILKALSLKASIKL